MNHKIKTFINTLKVRGIDVLFMIGLLTILIATLFGKSDDSDSNHYA